VIRTRYPGVGVLVLSQHIDAAYAMRLITDRSERVGYLLKDRIAEVAALIDALHRVHAGETVVDPGLVDELLDAPRRDDPLADLTPREREVLALVAQGRTDRGIGQALWLSPKTVETHIRTIFRKLDLPSSPSENRRVHAVLTFLNSGARS
jgi:serine/threonine-protein kinase